VPAETASAAIPLLVGADHDAEVAGTATGGPT
jgi:hypothetical protein